MSGYNPGQPEAKAEESQKANLVYKQKYPWWGWLRQENQQKARCAGMHLIPTLGKRRHTDLCEFQVSETTSKKENSSEGCPRVSETKTNSEQMCLVLQPTSPGLRTAHFRGHLSFPIPWSERVRLTPSTCLGLGRQPKWKELRERGWKGNKSNENTRHLSSKYTDLPNLLLGVGSR